MYDDISPEAKIAEDVKIDSGCFIEKRTKMSKGVINKSGVRIGENNHIHPYAVIGGMPQDIKSPKETGKIIIGDSNTVRKFSAIKLPVGEVTETK